MNFIVSTVIAMFLAVLGIVWVHYGFETAGMIFILFACVADGVGYWAMANSDLKE